MNWAALEARGMQLTRDEFWHPERGGVLSAAVQIGGCSASFCSPEGLVVTNHHCGFGAVNALSTPQRNLLRDGFVARTRAEELPAPGMVVFVVRRIEDVTAKVHAAQAKAKSPLELTQITDQVIRELVAEGEKAPDTTCSVAAFLEGKEYHLYHRTRLTDVRLVYAPPRAVGEYGGEVDNWEWPRHTGDFTFFRAYAAPDGSPRAHHAENVPFRPQHHLRVAAEGVRENDLVLILGYPGRTERYLSSLAVADREAIYYPKRLDLLTRIIAVLEAQAKKGDAEQLAYASAIKSLANVQKNAAGMVFGLSHNATVERKRREEAAFRAWVEGDATRAVRHGKVLDELLALDELERKTTSKDLVLGLALSPRIAPFLRGIVDLVDTAARRDAGAELDERQARAVQDPALLADFDAVQRPILEILLDELRTLDGDDAVRGRDALAPRTREASTAVVQRLLEQTKLREPAARLALLRGGKAAIDASDDPLVVLARGLAAERAELGLRMETMEGRRLDVGRRWIAAQEEWRGASFYPDANSTLRVSIANVKGYAPRDGVRYTPHTTVAGLLRKHSGNEPFDAPQALRDAAAARRTSRFFDARLGDVPVCFLADGDTTGGNSGSPVVNGKGELVGLNFDRVFEGVAGDYGWNAERSRNVCVDLRYVLWHIESVMPAPALLEELLGAAR
ncbi:MAG: S46 family peptidase [Planctomycetes bacterium]|nr:S46 family peptidase [Planctomycetota bacterium]